MLRFAAANLSFVIHQARFHHCQMMLVKDQGVYFLAENDKDILAYAIGCNPAVDKFDDWWELSRRELGGSDFVEYFNPHDPVFSELLEMNLDLLVEATPDHFILRIDLPTSDN
nr:DUF3085 domain-containing protein [Serratia fonticola]